MASVRKAEYYTMKVPQRPGAGAALLNALKKARVNLLAFTGFPAGGGAQVDETFDFDAAFVECDTELACDVFQCCTIAVPFRHRVCDTGNESFHFLCGDPRLRRDRLTGNRVSVILG